MHAKHIYFRWNHEARLCNFAGPDTPKPVDAPPAPEAKNDAQITIAPAAAETPRDTQAAAAGAAQERGGMQPADRRRIEEAAAKNKAAREAAAVPTSSPASAPASAPSEPVAPPAAPTSATTPEASATPGSSPTTTPESNGTPGLVERPATKEEMDASVAAEVAKMSPIKQQAFEKFMKLPTSPSAALTIAFFVGKMPEGALQASANGTQLSPQDLTQVADVVTSLTGPEFNFLKTLPLLPLDYGTPENPIDLQKAQTPEGYASLLREAAQTAVPESGDPNADRVNNAITDLKGSLNGKDMGKFLSALAELFASIKAIFKPEAAKDQESNSPQGPGKPPETGGNAPPNSPDGSPDAPGSPPEAGGEKQSEKRDRIRNEVQESGSINQFKKDKEASRDAKMGEYDSKIDAEQAENQALDDTNDGLKKQVTDAEQKLSNPKTKPEEKADLEKQIRDLNVTIKANDEHTENNRKDIKEMTDKRNKLYTDTENDIKEVDSMIKEAKDKVQILTKALEDLSKNPAAKELGADTLLSGVTITVDENKMDVVITLNEDAKKTLDALSAKGFDVKPIMDLVNGKPMDAPGASPAAPAAKPAAAGEKTVEQTEQQQDQIRATKGLIRVAGKFGINQTAVNSLGEKGDTKAIASMIIDALKTQEHPVYIDTDGSLYANESALGMDWVNPDTQIVNSNFSNFLMTNPEAAMRALGEYGNKAKALNPDTRGFLYELATAYEQGARTA